MNQNEWVEYGLAHDFCGPVVCATHDCIPMTREEDEAFNEGFDPCVYVIRPYTDTEERKVVEENHSASVSRRNGL